jgi:hypothetical protein
MKNILVGIILTLSMQYLYNFYKVYNNKNIVLDIVNLKNCVVNAVHKEDTLMYSQDGKKVFFLKANLVCKEKGDIMAEMQYVEGRKRDRQGLKIYWENGSWSKSGLWYHP